jgi:hypothetical protein
MRRPFKSFLQYHNSNCKAIPEMAILAYCLFEEKRQKWILYEGERFFFKSEIQGGECSS